ncbi:MAE_28990/MAE_18760 family HEPN-like nuclease [Streptomyces sp. NPDC004838]
MNIADLKAELEEDLVWRLDELRHLKNRLLGDEPRDQWSAASMRTILVMQYAHLEGFTRNAFAVYVDVINSESLMVKDMQPQLMAAALTEEFDAVRKNVNSDGDKDEDGRLTRRAKNQVAFVEKMHAIADSPVTLVSEVVASMEMNLGRDVLRRCLYMLAIPGSQVPKAQYSAIEFVKNARNDIAHGSRKERISVGMFDAHRQKCEQFMKDLIRLITLAASSGWFRKGAIEVD